MWDKYFVGKKWGRTINPKEDEYREVISIDEVVTTEAGTFNNCIKIRQIEYSATETQGVKFSYIHYKYWYVRNDIGIIKYEQYATAYRDDKMNYENFIRERHELKWKNF